MVDLIELKLRAVLGLMEIYFLPAECYFLVIIFIIINDYYLDMALRECAEHSEETSEEIKLC